MQDRTWSILEFCIKDFIRSGVPITSERLYGSHNFGIKPAMLRWELSELGERGFLVQTHISGGRLPTNKAYRFFAEKVLVDLESDQGDAQNAFLKESGRLFRDLASGSKEKFVFDFSATLKLFGATFASGQEFYQSGLSDLFDSLELGSKSELMNVLKDVESLPMRLEGVRRSWEREEEWPKVFVGGSPITKSSELSSIIDCFDLSGEKMVVVAIGPKRMDYEKPLKLLKSVKRKNAGRSKQ